MLRDDGKRIIGNALWMVFDKVFVLGLNLLVTIYVANYFGKDTYGNFQYAISIVAVIEILVTFVDARVVKKLYQCTSPQVVVYNATISRVIFSAISVIIGVVVAVVSNRGNQYSILLVLLIVNSIITNIKFGMVNRFEYVLKSKRVVIAADFAALISSILQIIAVKMSMNIITIAVIVLLSSIINLIVVYYQYRVCFPGSGNTYFSPTIIKSMIKESAPLAIAASCAIIYSRSDSIMIGSILSVAEVGVYSIALKIVSVIQIMITPIRESVYPKMIELYSSNKAEYARRYVQITSIMTWVYILGVSMSLLVLPYAFHFLSIEYAEAYPIYRIYVIGTYFMYNAILRAGHFTLVNKGSILMWSQIFSVILNVILNYFGIMIFGLYGAAIATVITQGISLLASNLFFGNEGREVFMWQMKGLNPLKMFR